MNKKAKTTKAEKVEKKIDLTSVTDVVKKIPAFLKRMKSELEKLMVLLDKAEQALAVLVGLQALTKEQKAQKKLLEKQIKGMKAYRDALQARVSFEEGKL